MDSRVARNTINFLLSDRLTFSGADYLPLTEIINALQQELDDGRQSNPPSGSPETES